MQRALVAFQRQDIVATLLHHLLGDGALAIERVGGDDRAVQRQHLQQLWHSGDLFDLSSVATCARTNREPAAQALTRCNGDRSAARSKERRSVLPSIAITPWAAAAKHSMNCMKQDWSFAGSSRRNTRLKVSWL